ncbi:hypothetical protein WA158_006341 [Blastocystis sp. Blastoise]
MSKGKKIKQKNRLFGVSNLRVAIGAVMMSLMLVVAFTMAILLPKYIQTNRSVAINAFNVRVTKWNEAKKELEKQKFTIRSGNDQLVMNQDTFTNGNLWPIRDTCTYEHDPPSGCFSTDEFYFSYSSFPYNDTIHLDISYSDYSPPIPYSIDAYQNIHWNMASQTYDDQYRSEICSFYGGIFMNNITCVVNGYIDSICLRITQNNQSEYILDTKQFDMLGCHPATIGKNLPFHVSPTKPNTISISIRHYLDPYISANYYTNYCSSIRINESNCLGQTPSFGIEYNSTGNSIYIFGLFSLIILSVTCFLSCCEIDSSVTVPNYSTINHTYISRQNNLHSNQIEMRRSSVDNDVLDNSNYRNHPAIVIDDEPSQDPISFRTPFSPVPTSA